MKNFKTSSLILVSISLGSLAACSTFSGNKSESAKELATAGPTVVDVKANPGTFEVNQNLQPISRSQVVANVKDFSNKVTDVRLRFVHIPLEIPMTQVSPSTWTADLKPDQLRMLAVNGHTMKYEANVIARDNKGQTAVSPNALEIAVRAPDINATG